MQRLALQKGMGIIAFIFLLAVLIVGGVLLWQTATTTVNPEDTQFTVDTHGTVSQSGHRVAVLGVDSTVTIPLINPRTTTVAQPVAATLTFSTPEASTHITPRIISIQGVGSVSYSWINSTQLRVTSGIYAPDSYTVLRLQALPSFFQPTFAWYVQEGIHSVSTVGGIIIGLGILLLAYLSMYRAMRRPAWKADGMQQNLPAGLTPIQLAILHHSSIEPVDFTAFLMFLASRGFIQIIEQANDVIFLRTGQQEGLAAHEVGLLQVLFPRENEPSRLSLLLQSLNSELFSAVVSQLYVEIYNTFSLEQFFVENPRLAHLRYKTVGILLQLSGLLLLLLAAWLYGVYPALLPLGLALYVAGVYVYRMARRVTSFAPVAAAQIAECAAFTSYLASPQPIGPEGDQGALFYRYAPYAIAARVEEPWVVRFASSQSYIPEWYVSDQENIIDPVGFIRRVEMIAKNLAQLMVQVKDPNAD